MRINFLSFLAASAIITALSACTPTIASRGNIIDHDHVSEVVVGTSTREEVANKLGTPTIISAFDDKIWYYMGYQTVRASFFDPEVKHQEAYEVRFDDKGIVTAVNQLDLADARDIVPAEGKTPTYGNDDTFIRQLLGNLSHPMPKMGNQNGQ